MAADPGVGFEQYRKLTKRDTFLATMEQIVPWPVLCAVIDPHYPKTGKGRPPIGLERMLRMYFVQLWFNLADAACEEARTGWSSRSGSMATKCAALPMSIPTALGWVKVMADSVVAAYVVPWHPPS